MKSYEVLFSKFQRISFPLLTIILNTIIHLFKFFYYHILHPASEFLFIFSLLSRTAVQAASFFVKFYFQLNVTLQKKCICIMFYFIYSIKNVEILSIFQFLLFLVTFNIYKQLLLVCYVWIISICDESSYSALNANE